MHALDLIDRHLTERGDYPRVVDRGRTWSTHELRDAARRLAGGLVDLDVRPGDRVAVMMRNSAEVLIAYEAIWRAGAAITPMLPALSTSEVAHILKDSEARALICDDDHADRVAADNSGGPIRVIVSGDTHAELTSMDGLLSESTPVEGPETRDPSGLAALLYTGGTTGRAKGVMLTHTNLVSNAVASAASYENEDGEINVVSLPLAHSYGLAVFLASHTSRMKLVILPRFEAERFLDTVADEGATSTDAVPAMLGRLLECEGLERLSTLKAVFTGGAPCPAELVERFESATGVPVLDGYGLTEASPCVCASRPSLPVKPGSSGVPLPGVEVRIVNSADEECPPGEPGEILVRSAGVMAGYWKDAEASSTVLVDGWLHTGDIGALDADGYLTVLGRLKDLIIRNGFNIHPLDIEATIRGFEGVADATVVGIPDPRLGERVVACVVGEVSEEDLRARFADVLAGYKRPDDIVLMDELPLTPIGKPDRKRLAAELGSV